MQQRSKSFDDLNKVYPIGYSRNGDLVEKLMQDNNVLLIDTRAKPWSKIEQWRQGNLLEKYQERYRYAGLTLGNENFNNGGPIKIANIEVGIKGLLYYLNKGHDLILLCGCASYEQCHLHIIIEALDQEIEVNVVKPSQLRSTLHICVRGDTHYRPEHKEDDVYTSWINDMKEETAKNLAKSQRSSKTDVGAKVYAEINKGNKVPAVILETAFSSEGNYLQCRLKIAQYNPMSQQWLVSQYNRPVQSYKLTRRTEVIPGLDSETQC